MTRLTMHAQGGMPPQSAAFAPPQPPQRRVPIWVIAGGGLLFLAMFAALVVTSTLLFVQSRDVRALQASMALDEPPAPVVVAQPVAAAVAVDPVQEAAIETEVTRTSVDLLSANLPAATPEPVRAPVPLGERIQAPSCIDYLDTLAKITEVRFPLGSNVPQAADMPRVRNIATALSQCPDVKMVVEGHSDQRGNPVINKELSWFRAETVIKQLQSEGFETAKFELQGFGATRPINLSGTEAGEAENRRVEFMLVPEGTVVTDTLARN